MAEFRRVPKQSRSSYRADQASLTPVYPPFHDGHNSNSRSEASGWGDDDFSYHTEPKCKTSEFLSSDSGWGTDGDDHLYAAAAQSEAYNQEEEEDQKEEEEAVVVDLRENERFVAEITSIVPMEAPKSSAFKVSTHNKFALLGQEGDGDDDSDDKEEERVKKEEEIRKTEEEIKKLEEELKKEEEEVEKIKEQIKKKKKVQVEAPTAQASGRYWWCSIL